MAVVAARQSRLPVFGRRSRVRRHRTRLAAFSVPLLALLFGLVLTGALELALTAPASAQSFTYNPLPPKPPAPPHNPGDRHLRSERNSDAAFSDCLDAIQQGVDAALHWPRSQSD